ncbi:MAG: TorF family putative porin [Sulfurimonas sp.]|uniref:TorF family putative porin n=1 Tax=Sulfurimonas sp. TaxID=2022749 RepID=UPI002608B3D2|nr:TorF family putative porin [Sulfurimonas sp.]MDD5401490.1 TorF family putative porin [Sulfurimonas sp.]
MKFIKLSLSVALITTMAFAEEEKKSDFGISANMAITSNYIFRGMTQTKNSPAVQGGVDLEYKGLYVGVWGSNVDFGDTKNSLEADIYGGYKSELAGIGFDIGAIEYSYPNMSNEYNFADVYFGLSKEWEKFGVKAKYNKSIKTNNLNPQDFWEIGASAKLPYDVGFSANYGDYHNIGTYYSIGLNRAFEKFELSITYIDFNHGIDSAADEENIVGTVTFRF